MWAAIKTIGVTFGMRNRSINKVHGQGFYLSQLLDPPFEQISRYSSLQQEHSEFQINTAMSTEAMTRNRAPLLAFS
jgi:hypothetical protein